MRFQRILALLNRFVLAGGVFIACGAAAPAQERHADPVGGTIDHGDGVAPESTDSKPNQQQRRIREGTRIEKTGYFKATGDGVTFYSADEKLRFRGLENLMLERVARTLQGAGEQLQWDITGTVTEFRGSNYLLITHAVLKTKLPEGRTGPLGPRKRP